MFKGKSGGEPRALHTLRELLSDYHPSMMR
jgi:hypothetical protein